MKSRVPIVRRAPERTAFIRHCTQGAFLLLNFWIGARFYLFVRYCESGGQSVFVSRPAGIDGWLPIAGLMNVAFFARTGLVPEVHAAGFFLFVAFVAVSFVFRKAFCSWLCPIGTISEWLWQGGRELFSRNLALPRWIDIPLRGLKYLILGFFAYAVLTLSAADLESFLTSPYGLIADVKLLDFFRTLSSFAALVIFLIVVASVFVKNAWCRYLCPYGALLGIVGFVSPTRVRRDPISCIDCGKCTTACPSLIPVASLRSVRTPECTSCLDCVVACPVAGALDLSIAKPRFRVSGAVLALGIGTILVSTIGYAMLSGRWTDAVPLRLYLELIPNAASFGH